MNSTIAGKRSGLASGRAKLTPFVLVGMHSLGPTMVLVRVGIVVTQIIRVRDPI
jgi:hypothetical protein